MQMWVWLFLERIAKLTEKAVSFVISFYPCLLLSHLVALSVIGHQTTDRL
jgi:hypothetical protein